MKFIHIKETCIYISDLEKTKSFYADKLGLEVIAMVEGMHVFFRAGNSVLLCFIKGVPEKNTHTPPHGATGQIHFAFEVNTNEYEDAKNEIIQKGISIEHEHEWKNNLLSFYFRDPDNNLVEIAQKGIWE
jgi:catechol 2,3-dioxygenase-like lactoylglutathione lyase family enzyme